MSSPVENYNITVINNFNKPEENDTLKIIEIVAGMLGAVIGLFTAYHCTCRKFGSWNHRTSRNRNDKELPLSRYPVPPYEIDDNRRLLATAVVQIDDDVTHPNEIDDNRRLPATPVVQIDDDTQGDNSVSASHEKKNETNKNEKDGGGDGGGNGGDSALDGVESARIGDSELNKLTVIGNVDPVKLRQKVEEKTKKKVEILSPASKKPKDGDSTIECDGGGGGKKKEQKQPENENDKTTKKDEKKPKELPVTTAVLKVPLHCQGCIQKIHKLVSKTKGYMEMSLDKEKDLVTVKGAIDMKILAAALQSKLERVVDIVPAKKDGGNEGEKKGGGGGEKKGKGGGGGGNDGEGKGGGGGKGEKKGKGGCGGGGGNDGGGGGSAGVFKMDTYGGGPVVYPYPQYTYGSGYADYVHAPLLFSDENPNACVIM